MKVFIQLDNGGDPPNKWHIYKHQTLTDDCFVNGYKMFCGKVFNEHQLPHCIQSRGVVDGVCDECVAEYEKYKLPDGKMI